MGSKYRFIFASRAICGCYIEGTFTRFAAAYLVKNQTRICSQIFAHWPKWGNKNLHQIRTRCCSLWAVDLPADFTPKTCCGSTTCERCRSVYILLPVSSYRQGPSALAAVRTRILLRFCHDFGKTQQKKKKSDPSGTCKPGLSVLARFSFYRTQRGRHTRWRSTIKSLFVQIHQRSGKHFSWQIYRKRTIMLWQTLRSDLPNICDLPKRNLK